jgi:hypothetical protein
MRAEMPSSGPRSDRITREGKRMEIQSRSLSEPEFADRERIADLWLFDLRDPYADGAILVQENEFGAAFRWKPAWTNSRACQRPVYFDLGECQARSVHLLLSVAWWTFDGKTCSGFGHLHTADAFRSWIQLGSPLTPPTGLCSPS